MSRTAFLFPGQGSQGVGLGRDLHDACIEARDLFERAGDARVSSCGRIEDIDALAAEFPPAPEAAGARA